MAKVRIRLAFTSRMKKTKLYTRAGKTHFGVWQRPEIKLDGDEKVLTVSEEHEGALDFISFLEYGDRAWWWALASVNKIRNVVDEVVVGLELTIPKLDNIRDAVQEQRDAESS